MDPEKKKTIVVGALFVAMLGIGAFQFAKGSGGGETPPPADGKKDAPAADGKDGDAGHAAKPGDAKNALPKNPMFASALGARDPFQPAAFSATTVAPAAPVKPTPAPAMPPRLGGGFVPSLPNAAPGGLEGELPPMTPGGGGTPLPTAPAPKPTFQGALIGVMVGARSAAVFRLGGAERIVPVGREIEPGVRLVSLRTRHAVVDFHGERLTLELHDEAPADNARPAATPKASAPAVPSLPTPNPALTLPNSGSEINND